VARFPCLPLTLLGFETFIFSLSSSLLLRLLQELSQGVKDGMTATGLGRVRTNLALFFSGPSLGSSAGLFNRALCLRGPGSPTTSRFARFAGCTGLAFGFVLGGGGSGFFENPMSFATSTSSNSSSNALFLAMFACLSSSLRYWNSTGMRYSGQRTFGLIYKVRATARKAHSLCSWHDYRWMKPSGVCGGGGGGGWSRRDQIHSTQSTLGDPSHAHDQWSRLSHAEVQRDNMELVVIIRPMYRLSSSLLQAREKTVERSGAELMEGKITSKRDIGRTTDV